MSCSFRREETFPSLARCSSSVAAVITMSSFTHSHRGMSASTPSINLQIAGTFESPFATVQAPVCVDDETFSIFFMDRQVEECAKTSSLENVLPSPMVLSVMPVLKFPQILTSVPFALRTTVIGWLHSLAFTFVMKLYSSRKFNSLIVIPMSASGSSYALERYGAGSSVVSSSLASVCGIHPIPGMVKFSNFLIDGSFARLSDGLLGT